jgi:hypothetical protein
MPGIRTPSSAFRLLAALILLAVTVLRPAPARAAAAEPQTLPLDIVIAVDESGSLSPEDVKKEVRAATQIAVSGLNRQSRVTVFGFGSYGTNPIDPVCPPTVLDTDVKRNAMRDCVAKLHPRTPAEGNDTDHAAALGQALSTFSSGSPDKALKVVFLLTDGKLDVRNSNHWGERPDLRNKAAGDAVTSSLAKARADGVQVWPLGFGEADPAELKRFAAGGSQQACNDRPESRPRHRIVSTANDVQKALLDVYTAAACYQHGETKVTTVPPGRELTLRIPAIATDGQIIVTKGDPRIRVEYRDPDGKAVPVSGSMGETQVSLTGQSSDVETLGLVNPKEGDWKVILRPPSGVGKQEVTATAIWQGAVQTAIVVDPPAARTGQTQTVWLSLVTRTTRTITDPDALAGLDFHVTASGPALSGPQPIEMHDDGKAPDDKAHDGRYAGSFTAPNTEGDVTFTGLVSGPGIHAENVSVPSSVSSAPQAVQGRVIFDAPDTVHPGDTVKGRVEMENGTSSTLNDRIVLEAPDSARATLSGGEITVPPGRSTRDFKITFGNDAGLGGTSLMVKVADSADIGKVQANGLLAVNLEKKPTWWDRYKIFVYAAAVLLATLILAWFEAKRRRRNIADVRGLVVWLTIEGEPVGLPMKPYNRRSTEFPFLVVEEDAEPPRLAYPTTPGERTYVARRGPAGHVTVTTTRNEYVSIPIGGIGKRVTTDAGTESAWALNFRDDRKGPMGPRGRPDTPAPYASSAPTSPNGAPATGPAKPYAPTATEGDQWRETTADDDDPWR